jgi:hypothetical protein
MILHWRDHADAGKYCVAPRINLRIPVIRRRVEDVGQRRFTSWSLRAMIVADAFEPGSWLVTIAIVVLALVGVWVFRGSRLLSLTPRIYGGGDWLIATSARRAKILCLFAFARTVTVDRGSAQITISRRSWWVARRLRRIPFARVAKILYSVDDLGLETTWGQEGNTLDAFRVQLELVDGAIVNLFTFYGEGTLQEGWDTPWWLPDWAWNLQRRFDVYGSQEIDSRHFVDRLQKLLDVPVGRPPG